MNKDALQQVKAYQRNIFETNALIHQGGNMPGQADYYVLYQETQDALAKLAAALAQPADTDPLVLHSVNNYGTAHHAASWLNQSELAPYLHSMHPTPGTGGYVTVVLRMPLSVKLDLQARGKL